jgi:DNA mismatch endonuclease (patch repair protein)
MRSKPSKERSRIMRAVKSRDTSPELAVRKLLSAIGYRFRLYSRTLPGAPDIVFPGRKKAIFVHGCFWHGHGCKRGARVPKTNRAYWIGKVARNVARDESVLKQLRSDGWKGLVIWECEIKDTNRLNKKIGRFLGGRGHNGK